MYLPEASSIMRTLSGARYTDVRLYTLWIKIGTNQRALGEHWHNWTRLWCNIMQQCTITIHPCVRYTSPGPYSSCVVDKYIFVQNNPPTEFSKMTIVIILRKICWTRGYISWLMGYKKEAYLYLLFHYTETKRFSKEHTKHSNAYVQAQPYAAFWAVGYPPLSPNWLFTYIMLNMITHLRAKG